MPLLELVAFIPSVMLLAIAATPFVFYPLVLGLLPRRPEDPVEIEPHWDGEGMAIVFCAYNEASVLERKFANLADLKARYPKLAIHCYSDGSSDRSAQIMEAHADLARVVISNERGGKSMGMNTLLSGVDAEVVVFTDANVLLDDAAPAVAHSRFAAEDQLGCLCGHLIYTNRDASTAASVSSAYWRLEERIKDLESNTGSGSTIGADGSLFAIRRALFDEVPHDIIDDMFTSVSILAAGWRVAAEPRFRAYEESEIAVSNEFRRKIRIACRAVNCHRLLWPRLRTMAADNLAKYLVHKLLRWWSGFFALASLLALVAAFAATVGSAAFWIVLSAVAASCLLIASVRRLRRLVISAAIMLAGTSLGVIASYRGKRYASWVTTR
ncbi:MAG: glycosyltransferase [Rhodospirillales bacterium]|nr:glycosyltransferase [Rhodospirillales bacterium]